MKLDGAPPGSFAQEAGELGSFRPFRQLPNGVSWSSARVNLLDLNGDGRDDYLTVVTNTHYVWYPSLGAEGFGDPQMRPIADSDDNGPSLWPSTPPHMGVFFADMTGDGQPDLVRVLPGQVAYWPNLGHGRFRCDGDGGLSAAPDPPPRLRSEAHSPRGHRWDRDGRSGLLR
ncbi:MAG: VCBS repeat-containing protein [Polyangiaceae bacterium]